MKVPLILVLCLLFGFTDLRFETDVYEKTLKAGESDTLYISTFMIEGETAFGCHLVEGKDVSAEAKFQIGKEDYVQATKWEDFEVPLFYMKKGSTAGYSKTITPEVWWQEGQRMWLLVTNHRNRPQRIKIQIYTYRRNS